MHSFYQTKNQSSNRVNLSCIDDLPNMIYKPKKIESNRIIDLYKNTFHDSQWLTSKIERMVNCSNYLVFNTPVKNGEWILNRSKITAASFCRERYCPMCSYRLSRKQYMNLAKVLSLLMDCKRQFIFLTLTIPNVKGNILKDTLVDLQKAWKRFYNNRFIKSRFRGFFRSVEVTYNKKDGTFNPHIHVIIDVENSYYNNSSNYLNHDKITDIWTKCNSLLFSQYIAENPNTNISGFITYIKKVNDMTKACYELSKYCVKSTDIVEDSFQPIYDALFNTKCHSYVGEFKIAYDGLKLDDDIIDSDEELTCDFEWIRTHFTYDHNIQAYIMKESEMVSK